MTQHELANFRSLKPPEVTPMFSITAAPCQMGKISNNIENHGDEDVSVFTIPIKGVMIDAHALCVLMHDLRASDAFFERKAGVLEPRDWVASIEPISITDEYDGMATEIKLGEESVTFSTSRLKDIKLGRFFVAGMIQVDCKLQLEPGLDRPNLLLQEYQNEPMVLTVENAKVAAKKKLRQTDMFEAAANGEAPAAAEVDANEQGESSEPMPQIASNDPLYDDVVTFVRESRITTVGGVQIQFNIDYSRASLILGAMELDGIVGPVREDNSRKILDVLPSAEPLNAETPQPNDDPDEDDEGSDDGEDDEEADANEGEQAAPDVKCPGESDAAVSSIGRQVTAHAKRQARKSASEGKASKAASGRKSREVRTH